MYRLLHDTHMDSQFGSHIRSIREELLAAGDKRFTLRQVAQRLGIEPSYLSKVETGKVDTSLKEETIRQLASELGEDPDVLLALSGKISSDLLKIISSRPQLFAELIRQLKDAPNRAVLRIVREVRDGSW